MKRSDDYADHNLNWIEIASIKPDNLLDELRRDTRASGSFLPTYDLLQYRWRTPVNLDHDAKVASVLTVLQTEALQISTPVHTQSAIATPTRPSKTYSSKNGIPYAEQIAETLWTDSYRRFNPAFIELDYKPKDKAKYQQAVDLWQQESPQLVAYLAQEGASENEYTAKFCTLANQVGDMVHGNVVKPSLVFGDKGLDRNSSLTFMEGHGGDWRYDGHKVKPDIHIFDPHQSQSDAKNWKDVWLAGVARRDPKTDMRCTHFQARYNIIPRTMYYQSLLSRNHPSTGQTYTITLTGGYLRFWIFDAFAYSSSRLFDLKDRQHSRQVVDLIAYLLSPSRTGPERWLPDNKSVTVLTVNKDIQTWKWSGSATPPYLWLEVRAGLWAPRTNAVAGMATKGRETISQQLVIKTGWLSERLIWHEQRMLQHLHGDLCPGNDKLIEAQAPRAAELVRPEVIECLPRPGGLVKSLVDRLCWTQAVSISAEPEREAESTHRLCFIAQVFLGPLGQRMPTEAIDNFGIRKYTQVLKGAFESLWYASSKGVHYRDINWGNIMWRQGATPDDVIGYVIDYGNSRHLEENRIQARGHDSNGLMLLCEDDARSVTVLYQSIQSLQADKLTKEYADIKPQLDEAERKYQEELSQASDQDLPEKSMDTLALESRVNRCLAAAIKVKHRYTDDLESILYSFLHLVWTVTGATVKKLETCLQSLDSKREAWELKLFEYLGTGLGVCDAWKKLIAELASKIQTARSQLAVDGYTPELTPIETICFWECIQLIDSAIDKLPHAGFV